MEITRLAGLLSVLALTACNGVGQPNAVAAKSDVATEWKFDFFTPKALPALVTFAVVQDADGTIYRFNTLNSTPALPKVIGEWNDKDRPPEATGIMLSVLLNIFFFAGIPSLIKRCMKRISLNPQPLWKRCAVPAGKVIRIIMPMTPCKLVWHRNERWLSGYRA